MGFDSNTYGPVIAELLRDRRLMPLGPGNPNPAVRSQLETLSPETAFAHTCVGDRDMAAACCAALWLYHDYLDESHTISQTRLRAATGRGSFIGASRTPRTPPTGSAACASTPSSPRWRRRPRTSACSSPLIAGTRLISSTCARSTEGPARSKKSCFAAFSRGNGSCFSTGVLVRWVGRSRLPKESESAKKFFGWRTDICSARA